MVKPNFSFFNNSKTLNDPTSYDLIESMRGLFNLVATGDSLSSEKIEDLQQTAAAVNDDSTLSLAIQGNLKEAAEIAKVTPQIKLS